MFRLEGSFRTRRLQIPADTPASGFGVGREKVDVGQQENSRISTSWSFTARSLSPQLLKLCPQLACPCAARSLVDLTQQKRMDDDLCPRKPLEGEPTPEPKRRRLREIETRRTKPEMVPDVLLP